jgi:hypothetical protein
MKANDKIKFVIIAPIIALFFIAQGVLNTNIKKPTLEISKQESSLNIDVDFLRYASFGHARTLADLLWITTLIESDLEHYKKKDLNSWMYLRFMSIIELDPRRYYPYYFGGRYLAIIKDDIIGAEKIYLRGLKLFPEDFQLNFNTGYLYTFEFKDDKKALPFWEAILDSPKAPIFLPSLVNRIRASAGIDLEEVFNLVLVNFNTTKDENMKMKLEKDLYAIRAQIDLECLNNKKQKCNTKDLLGNPYYLENGSYRAINEFKEYKVNRKR